MPFSSISSWQTDAETMKTVTDFIFLGSKISADGDCSHEIKRRLFLGRKAMTNLDIGLKSRDITMLTKVHLVKAMFFFSSLVWMWELDYKESWAPKNWCFWIVVLEKTSESPLDSKETKSVNHKENQLWIFIGRTDAKAEAPIFGRLMRRTMFGKDTDAGKDWGQEEKRMTEDEMVGLYHRFNVCDFEQVLGVGDGQGRLACCIQWDHKELDTTKQLNWLNWTKQPKINNKMNCSNLCTMNYGYYYAWNLFLNVNRYMHILELMLVLPWYQQFWLFKSLIIFQLCLIDCGFQITDFQAKTLSMLYW